MQGCFSHSHLPTVTRIFLWQVAMRHTTLKPSSLLCTLANKKVPRSNKSALSHFTSCWLTPGKEDRPLWSSLCFNMDQLDLTAWQLQVQSHGFKPWKLRKHHFGHFCHTNVVNQVNKIPRSLASQPKVDNHNCPCKEKQTNKTKIIRAETWT